MSDDNVKQFPAHRIHRIPVNLPEGIDGPVPWDRCLGTPAQVEHNNRALEKIFGVPQTPVTPEIENDPRNPNVRPQP